MYKSQKLKKKEKRNTTCSNETRNQAVFKKTSPQKKKEEKKKQTWGTQKAKTSKLSTEQSGIKQPSITQQQNVHIEIHFYREAARSKSLSPLPRTFLHARYFSNKLT